MITLVNMVALKRASYRVQQRRIHNSDLMIDILHPEFVGEWLKKVLTEQGGGYSGHVLGVR